jgi:hypothetical protein|tara:strand:- start:534 stop:935 length:402 start_codon:yes stop_codon:yes gene_type:complete
MTAKKELTQMQEAFLEALCSEARGDIRAAMNAAGYSPNTRISEVVTPLRDEIVDRASMVLAMNAPKATFSMVDVLNDPGSMGARNAVAAATQILDRTGLVKKEQIEIKGPEGGVFILPPKKVTPADDEADYDE